MKIILTIIISLSWYAVSAYAVIAQDATPRGPAQWTSLNWLGFCLQIGIFVLIVIGIYKLAMSGEGDRGNVKSEIQPQVSAHKTTPLAETRINPNSQ